MPNDLITLSTAPHPFEAATKTIPVAEGQSLAAMLILAQPDPLLALHAVAFVDGEMIDREHWSTFYPNAGTLVELRVLPTGGGGGSKDTLRTVLSLAVLVASVTIPGLQVLGLSALRSKPSCKPASPSWVASLLTR